MYGIYELSTNGLYDLLGNGLDVQPFNIHPSDVCGMQKLLVTSLKILFVNVFPRDVR